jgi:uncharacterized repeat protein (TIGR01451 family)
MDNEKISTKKPIFRILQTIILVSSGLLLCYVSKGFCDVSVTETMLKRNQVYQSNPFRNMGRGKSGKISKALSTSNLTNTAKRFIVDEYQGNLPLFFEANKGQTNSQVKFLSRGLEYSLFLASNEAVIALGKQRVKSADMKNQIDTKSEQYLINKVPEVTETCIVRMKLVGASEISTILGEDKLIGKSNYFKGSDTKKWTKNVPHFGKVRYKEVYSGIDLVFYGNTSRLEYDFIVSPGAKPDAIRLAFSGAEKLVVDTLGNLIIAVPSGEIMMKAPSVYQEDEGKMVALEGRYVLSKEKYVTFEVANYEAKKKLIIDPVLEFSTYYGGSGEDIGFAVALDSEGNVFMVGSTTSQNFPIIDALDPMIGGEPDSIFGEYNADVFVSKFSPDGKTCLYSTYLGGSRGDVGYDIAIDTAGNAIITGVTGSNDFPTIIPIQAQISGHGDIFVAKINPDGSELLYSTYLGGTGNRDTGRSLAVDTNGNAYITGWTTSSDFPTVNPLQDILKGGYDAIVAKLNSAGSALLYCTFLGGSGSGLGDFGYSIAVDTNGNAYITGKTDSSDFPTTGSALQTSYAGGDDDVFISKINSTGTDLIYSSFLGGSGDDEGYSIAVDGIGNAYITGRTESADFTTTAGAFLEEVPFSSRRAFVSKIDSSGSSLEYSTYFGGSGGVWANAIAVDSAANAYICGVIFANTLSTLNAFQENHGDNGGFSDAFITVLNPTGTGLIYSSYLGGSWRDEAFGIAVDDNGNVYLSGSTDSENFPLTNAIQVIRGENPEGNIIADAFLAKIIDTSLTLADLTITMTDNAPDYLPGCANVTFTSNVTNDGPNNATNVILTGFLDAELHYLRVTVTQGGCTPIINGSVQTIRCDLGNLDSGSTAVVQIVAQNRLLGLGPFPLSNHASVSSNIPDPNISNNDTGAGVSALPAASCIGNSSGGAKSYCFISTVAYGSITEQHVKILRDFRDRFLKGSNIGKIILKTYYKYSLSMAGSIAKQGMLRTILGIILLSILGVSWVAFKTGLLSAIALMLLFNSFFIGIIWFR